MKQYEQVDDTAGVLDYLAIDINNWAEGKGFWNIPTAIINGVANDPSGESLPWLEMLMKTRKAALITTETSELVEGLRKSNAESGCPGFTNEEEEMADQIIRILDYCGHYSLRIGEAVCAKMAVNEGRPYQHGKSF